MKRLVAIAFVIVSHTSLTAAQDLSDASCQALAGQNFSDAVGVSMVITKAETVTGERDHCHVLATIAPSTGVEIQLPATGWNGRLLFTGCGGLCGVIRTEQGADALNRGFAVATTDMGHSLTPDEDPRAWTVNEHLVEQWVHIATHQSTVLAKAVIAAAYGQPHDYAYLRGCSTGGRQGLVEALMYPDDFDGIISGAPAAQMVSPHNVFAYASSQRADGSAIFTKKALNVLADGALAACDRDDGVKDGVIGNPFACPFEPASLQCTDGQTDDCLTAEQVSAAEEIYQGARRADGTPFYSMGYAKGTERDWISGFLGTDGGPPRRAGSARFILDKKIGPEATLADFDYANHGASGSPVGGLMDLGDDGRKMEAFIEAGGKLLMYHGWSDTDATPASSLWFYNAQAEVFGEEALPEFLRLFFMPGMTHCRGGPGVETADYLSAIVDWVENGNAPDSLDAYGVDLPGFNYPEHPLDPYTVTAGRRLYPHPARSVYDGSGDTDDPDNWVKQ